MKRTWSKIVSLAILAIVLVPSYAAAEVQIDSTLDVDFEAYGDPDVLQNHLDDGEESNADTWNPSPRGVYYGGWVKESSLRVSEVPTTNCEVALAQVVRVPAEVVMSGASYYTVRTPLRTTNSTWSDALLNIYEIDESTNWTFIENETYADALETIPHQLNNLRVSFTEGPHQLVYYSHKWDPEDQSPSDGDDHWTRENRTYCTVNAPLSPDRYYLFVTYAWFDADAYIDVYWQPNSLSDGEWNRSTVAVYNEIAPDDHQLDVEDFNVSLGYSFDFVNGFGESSCGLNRYFYNGDVISFWSYLDPDDVDTADYLSIMVPFRSSNESVQITTEVWAVDMGDTASAKLIDDTSTWNDFLLVSDATDLATGIGGLVNFTGWFRIRLTISTEGRYRFSLWDLPYTVDTGFNESWFEETRVGWPFYESRWIHDDDYRWNPLEFVKVDATAGEDQVYHWHLMHSLQTNDYVWNQVGGTTPKEPPSYDIENMSLTSAFFYVKGSVIIKVGEWISIVHPLVGYGVQSVGVATQVIALSNVIPDWVGKTLDAFYWLAERFAHLGEWLLKVGERVVGGLKVFFKLLEVVLAIAILIMAVVTFFVPFYLTARGGLFFRKVVLGRFDEGLEDLASGIGTVKAVIGRGGG